MRRYPGVGLVVLALVAFVVLGVACRLVAPRGPKRGPASPKPPSARTAPPPANAPQPASPGQAGGELLFHEGFETGKVGSGWTGFAMSPKTSAPEDSDSIDIVTSPVRKGRYALKVIVHPGDAVTAGDKRVDKERCELLRVNSCRNGSCRFGDEGKEGSEIWYVWSVLIPEDYQYVSTSAKNYQIMGQWHDQPEPGRKPTGNSPPISVHYRASGGRQGFQINYGLIQRGGPIQTLDAPIQKGKWVDLMFRIRFSQGSDGFLEAWKDGVMLASEKGATRITGPNMFNAEPNYLRLGLYRGKGQTQTNTFYYDEIRIATSKAALLRE